MDGTFLVGLVLSLDVLEEHELDELELDELDELSNKIDDIVSGPLCIGNFLVFFLIIFPGITMP